MRIYIYVGPGAQSEDIGSSEDGETLLREFALVNEEVRYDHESPRK